MPVVAAEEQLLPYALCTYKDVQIAMQGVTSAAGNTPEALTRLINGFTAKVQGGKFMDRELELKARTEFFDVNDPYGLYQRSHASSRRLVVAAPPFKLNDAGEPIVQVWASSARVYDETTLLVPFVDYDIDVKYGVITALKGRFASGARAVKVAYEGGLVIPGDPGGTPPTDPIAPHDLKDACAQQIAVLFSRRNQMGADSVSVPGGGSIVLPDPTRWLKGVRDTIHAYKIYRGFN